MKAGKRKVLVIDDDPDAFGLVKAALGPLYLYRGALSGEDGLKALWNFAPDLLVLDMHLPGIDGLDMLRLIREDSRVGRLRIVVASADMTEETFQKAFEAGADDFVRKPLVLSELRQRVANCFAHVRDSPRRVLDRRRIVLDLDSRQVSADGREARLSPTEFSLLRILLEMEGRAVSREALLDALPKAANSRSTRSLDMHIANLRRKLGEAGRLVETLPEIGYRLKPS